jgi:hypothetical protein
LVIDHVSRQARYISVHSVRDIKEGQRLRVAPSDQVLVVVSHTNSAFYDYTIKKDVSVAPELMALRTYLSALGPYGSELNVLVPGRLLLWVPDVGPLPGECAPASSIASELQRLDRFISGGDPTSAHPQSLADIRGEALVALTGMARSEHAPGQGPTETIEGLAQQYRSELPLTTGHRGQERLWMVDSLITTLESLRQGRREIDRNSTCGNSEDLKKLRQNADEALKQMDAILAAAYDTEKLALTVASARSIVVLDTVAISPDSALSIEVKIAPKGRPEFARLADPRPLTVGVGLRPRWRIVPSVGLSLTYSPKSRFATFGTRPAPADSADIVAPGLEDRRFGWALSLSLTPFGEALDRKLPTPWLDFSINPSDAVRSLGLGVSFSSSFLKLGTGVLWTKHTELDGQSVTQRLETASDLRTRQTYGAAKWYVGLSLIGVPPFAK